ncbi:MAG: AsnC family transcriptional regulator [Nanoarchaeota archaeon]|nr:AsnC family transcriptional regulator [Nanoarchaeota archaeon]
MSKSDYEFIYLRSENSREKLKTIAQRLGKTSQRLKYNEKTALREKVISNPYMIFDYSHMGLILFKVYFRGVYMSDKNRQVVINVLEKNAYITSIYELTGGFDLVVEFMSPNPSNFNKQLRNIVTALPVLNDYKIILNLVTHIYPRNYLVKKDIKLHKIEKIIGGDREIDKFTANEMKVIGGLLNNPTIKYSRLAKEKDLNVRTVKSIMQELESRRRIRGNKYILDMEKLGVDSCRLFLNLHNLSKEREFEFMSYLMGVKEIVQVNKTVGDWDMEIDLEAFGKNRIRRIIVNMKEEFKDIIQNFSLIDFYKYHKRTYLPEYLFEE